jgi:hypothetical protein
MEEEEDDKKKKKKKGPASKKQKRTQSLSVQEIMDDNLTMVGLEYWASSHQDTSVQQKPYTPSIIDDIYHSQLKKLKLKSVMLLEVSHYLEK